MAEQNIGLAYKVVREFNGCGIEDEDLVAICFMGLVKAERRYDPETGNAFSTYAVPVMRNEVCMELRKIRRRRAASVISLDEQLESGELIAEMIPDQKDPYSALYVADLYEDCMKCLNEKEKAVITSLMHGERQEQIGAKLGISQSYVSRICRTARRKMKKVV